MNHYLAEFLGTMILIVFGEGVVANTVLAKTKGQLGKNGGWLMISTAWAFAIALPVYMFGGVSGAHFNPAFTISLAVIGMFPWSQVPGYIAAQMLGGFAGAVIVYLAYYPHFEAQEDPIEKLAVFATIPNIKNKCANLINEIISTFFLVFIALGVLKEAKLADGWFPFIIGLLVWGILLSLGGPTGPSINPARDLAPRIAHAVLPIPGKGSSNFKYAWIATVGPIIGAILGAVAYKLIF